MVYIPTIHTFEDDINENKNIEESPMLVSADSEESNVVKNDFNFNKDKNILVPAIEEESSSLTKKILTLISIMFIVASISLAGYYFYSKYKSNQQNLLNVTNSVVDNSQNQNIENDINKILPNLSSGISPYISEAVQNGNVIILSIKDNTDNGVDNYSLLYAYILAHQKDLGRDLVTAFDLNNLEKKSQENSNISDLNSTSSSDNINPTSSTSSVSTTSENNILTNIGNSFENSVNNVVNKMSKPTLISGDSLVWESKTLNNQDLEIANAGIINLIYGYTKQKYLIFTTSLKDYFDTVTALK